MVNRTPESNVFEYVVVAALRTRQLMRGCVARVPHGAHKATTTAQLEVSAGKIVKLTNLDSYQPAGISH